MQINLLLLLILFYIICGYILIYYLKINNGNIFNLKLIIFYIIWYTIKKLIIKRFLTQN